MTDYRAIWISDVHMGTRASQVGALLDFLRQNDSDTLYLVGDIFDGWALKRSWFWDQPHNDVVQKLLRKVRKGTRVIYIPGNHDQVARQFTGHFFGGVEVVSHAIHVTADGRRLVILHGDEFDGLVRAAPWLQQIGSLAYDVLIELNRWYNRCRSLLGRPYWSLSSFVKQRTKAALQYVDDFESLVVARAEAERAAGVVCGHIHQPMIRTIQGLLYANCGDWVESCTALVEHRDGRLEIISWFDGRGPESGLQLDHEIEGAPLLLPSLQAPAVV
jgi:UDP-2,3-diacylglucosamine pyrophosphatase LpxH